MAEQISILHMEVNFQFVRMIDKSQFSHRFPKKWKKKSGLADQELVLICYWVRIENNLTNPSLT